MMPFVLIFDLFLIVLFHSDNYPGTQLYDAQKGAFIDLGILDVMQVLSSFLSLIFYHFLFALSFFSSLFIHHFFTHTFYLIFTVLRQSNGPFKSTEMEDRKLALRVCPLYQF